MDFYNKSLKYNMPEECRMFLLYIQEYVLAETEKTYDILIKHGINIPDSYKGIISYKFVRNEFRNYISNMPDISHLPNRKSIRKFLSKCEDCYVPFGKELFRNLDYMTKYPEIYQEYINC